MMRVRQELEATVVAEYGPGAEDEEITMTRYELLLLMQVGVRRVAARDPDLSFLVREGLGLGARVERSRVRDKWSRI
ncbi:hypothetical protein H1O16_gp322 [Burkholderia phage BcepSaruman]|uniref:Uncharacterized protein n=1 Tax=Burkholderia phage BcepSaruman TaxID=2530032 RepID=A0A4D5ZCG6_9CAUD|nr:hypothetical protein H1O16_gp322 [Burkholderia phage BcepSaruman]QBX06735.1 hypothetical protein BcepSaruman_322 [Burkholderia phage BcepSaruman]